MRYLISILIILNLTSCCTTKISTTHDNSKVSIKVDTLLVLQKDSVKFDSLLSSYFLLKEMMNQEGVQNSIRYDSLLKIKQKIKKQLYKGAIINDTFNIFKEITITSKDSSYYKEVVFKVIYNDGNISLLFNSDFEIPTTTIIKTKNEKNNLIGWLNSKYSLYAMITILLLIVLLIFKFR